MTHRLATDYAKIYCNRTPIVKVIVENVVTCFWGHNVVGHLKIIICPKGRERQDADLGLAFDRARFLKLGGHEKPDIPGAFHERRTSEFGGGIRGPPSPGKKLNLGLADMQFPAVLRGFLALFNLFLVDHVLNSSPPHPHY